jgi:FeS assembly protein IscX
MEMSVKIQADVITDIRFRTFGCGAAIATSSMATELIKGKSIDDALEISNRAIVEALDGLPPVKVHCSVLAAEALRATLADYFERIGDLERAAELQDEDVVDPVATEEAAQPVRWGEFGRLVRAMWAAYPDIEPLDLSSSKLFKMVVSLPGFDDDPEAATEEYLEKLQMAWHEVRAG